MKFWYGYGSEHSANIVMIGEFKTIEGADKVNEIITKIYISMLFIIYKF